MVGHTTDHAQDFAISFNRLSSEGITNIHILTKEKYFMMEFTPKIKLPL